MPLSDWSKAGSPFHPTTSRALVADQARHGPADVEVRVLDARPLHLQTAAHGLTWLDKVAGGFEPDPGVGAMADEARRLGQERAEIRKGWGSAMAMAPS